MLQPVASTFINEFEVGPSITASFLAVILFRLDPQTSERDFYGKDSEQDTYLEAAWEIVDTIVDKVDEKDLEWPTETKLLRFLYAAAIYKLEANLQIKGEWINEAVSYVLWNHIPQSGPETQSRRLKLLGCLGPFMSAYDALIATP